MPTEIRTLAGAVDYNGTLTGDPGRIEFPAADIAPGLRARIYSISYFGANVTKGFTLTLAVPPLTPPLTTVRQRLRDTQADITTFYYPCGFIVPPGGFFLEVVSSGKSGAGTIIVDWLPDVAAELRGIGAI